MPTVGTISHVDDGLVEGSQSGLRVALEVQHQRGRQLTSMFSPAQKLLYLPFGTREAQP